VIDDARKQVGAQIKRAREKQGWSQAQLAQRLDRTQTSISYWESGRRSPDVDDLFTLASVLDIDVTALFAHPEPARSARAVFRAEAHRLELGGVAEQVEAFADAAEELPVPRSTVQLRAREPLAAAQELLAVANVKRPPVQVGALAKRCGIRVLEWDFGSEISGLLLDLDSGPAIGFNGSQTPGRQRFTVAHELGHHLLSHHDNFHIDLASATALGEAANYSWRDERAANDFAAELLMPAAMVVAAVREQPSLDDLAEMFDVSRAAMGFRLINLGLK
jgi:Zn-dependent peptidase ImmA (M78 family)/DNA-binding XRE family transcriptional regulator